MEFMMKVSSVPALESWKMIGRFISIASNFEPTKNRNRARKEMPSKSLRSAWRTFFYWLLNNAGMYAMHVALVLTCCRKECVLLSICFNHSFLTL